MSKCFKRRYDAQITLSVKGIWGLPQQAKKVFVRTKTLLATSLKICYFGKSVMKRKHKVIMFEKTKMKILGDATNEFFER